jgi:hypothetical protein
LLIYLAVSSFAGWKKVATAAWTADWRGEDAAAAWTAGWRGEDAAAARAEEMAGREKRIGRLKGEGTDRFAELGKRDFII